MDSSYQEITEALGAYFDGFYASDVAMLQGIFHPNCHLYSAGSGELVDDDMTAVYARVEGRTPPAAAAPRRRGHGELASGQNPHGWDTRPRNDQTGFSIRLSANIQPATTP